MRFIEVKTEPVGQNKNDCHYCVFRLTCSNPCRLESGYHYEEVE